MIALNVIASGCDRLDFYRTSLTDDKSVKVTLGTYTKVRGICDLPYKLVCSLNNEIVFFVGFLVKILLKHRLVEVIMLNVRNEPAPV